MVRGNSPPPDFGMQYSVEGGLKTGYGQMYPSSDLYSLRAVIEVWRSTRPVLLHGGARNM